MSTPDSLTTALLEMSDVQYGILILKMLGVLGVFLGGLGGFVVFVVKAWGWAWKKALDSMKADLSASFCTPKQLQEAMEKISARLNEGDERMQRTEDEMRRTREAVEQGNRRFTRILALLVAQDGATRHSPMLQAALESDSELPLFDLPSAGGTACA